MVVPGSVTVMAVDDRDRVLVTRQWIYPHGTRQWRLPGGGIDAADAGPLAAAQRELLEEGGVRAARWEPLGRVHGADSVTNHVDHVYLATGLSWHEQNLDDTEADLTVNWLPFHDVLALRRADQLPHAGSSFAVLTMALRRAEHT